MDIKRNRTKRFHSEIDKMLINRTYLILFLIIFGIILLDFLGLLNIRDHIMPLISRIPGVQMIVPGRTEDIHLLAKEEFKKQELARKLEWDKLEEFKEKLKDQELKLKEKEKSLERIEAQLKEKEKLVDKKYEDKENYKQKIEQQAKYFISMRPEEAVKRLQNLDDLLVIDVFKEIERQALAQDKQSLVPYYLSLMDPVRASTIQRKMTVVEEDISRETNQ